MKAKGVGPVGTEEPVVCGCRQLLKTWMVLQLQAEEFQVRKTLIWVTEN